MTTLNPEKYGMMNIHQLVCILEHICLNTEPILYFGVIPNVAKALWDKNNFLLLSIVGPMSCLFISMKWQTLQQNDSRETKEIHLMNFRNRSVKLKKGLFCLCFW